MYLRAGKRGHSSSIFARERKRRNLLLSYHLFYLLVFAFVYILGWAAIFNKGLGMGGEAEDIRKHMPEPE